MDAIVLAGGEVNENDLLFDEAPHSYKALLQIAGKPMIQWVLDALGDSEKIDDVILVGLPENLQFECKKNVIRVADHAGIVQNITAGAEKLLELGRNPQAKVMTVSGDVPSITPQVVDWLAGKTEDLDVDLAYSLIEQENMEIRFPGSKRSYIKLKDVVVCGGDVNVIRLGAIKMDIPLVNELTSERKNALHQASLIGFGTLFLLLIRQLTIANAEKRICKKLGIKGKAILNPFAETGMDVDKPFQLEIMRKDLAKRA